MVEAWLRRLDPLAAFYLCILCPVLPALMWAEDLFRLGMAHAPHQRRER
jgi:hypothetical protein